MSKSFINNNNIDNSESKMKKGHIVEDLCKTCSSEIKFVNCFLCGYQTFVCSNEKDYNQDKILTPIPMITGLIKVDIHYRKGSKYFCFGQDSNNYYNCYKKHIKIQQRRQYVFLYELKKQIKDRLNRKISTTY